MKFTEYINSHHVFTTANMEKAVDSIASANEQLRLAVKCGSVKRARRGLIISNHGRFENASLDPVEIVNALDPQAIISYHSALEAYGVAHNISFVCQFRSNKIKTKFDFEEISYQPMGALQNTRSKTLRSGAQTYRVTTREQTAIDCLGRTDLAGGAEEAIRSLSALEYLDTTLLAKLAVSKGSSMAARIGWLLAAKKDEWHVEEHTFEFLKSHISSGPYRLLPTSENSGWSSQWRLILPESNSEVNSWITHT